MASLTLQDLRSELQRLPLVSEARIRSVFREELEGIVAVLRHAPGASTCRLPDPLAPSNGCTHEDAAETMHGLGHTRRSTGTEKGAGMVQDFAHALDSLEKPMAKICVKDMLWQKSVHKISSNVESGNLPESCNAMVRQISNRSGTLGASSDLQAPPRSHPQAPTEVEVLLPGDLFFSRPDEQREAIRHTPVTEFNVEVDEVVPSVKSNMMSKSHNQDCGISMEAPFSPRRSERSIDTSTTRVMSKDSKTKGTHKIRSRTLEDLAVQTTSKSIVRRWAARIVGHWAFDYVVAGIIMLNGVLVGVQTDYLARELTNEPPFAFQVAEVVFCAVFTIELCLRLCTYGISFLTMSGKGWNIFDLFVVMAQLLEIGMQAVASGTGYSFNLLRVLRLIRVVRLARALRLIGELRTIVSSIAGSMKPLFWTGILLFMVVYVLGVYTTQVVLSRRISYRDDNEITPPDLVLYWGSLTKSMMSLFQSITGGIDWDQASRPLAQYISPEMGILFSLYIGLTVFCILNVVTGVFIESVMKNAKSENELRVLNHVMQLIAKFDVQEGGEITWEDFEKNLHKKEMQEFFKTIDVEIDNARTLFELLDVDSSGSVDVREFMDGCLNIWAPTRGLDLRMMLRDVNKVLSIVLEERRQNCRQPEAYEVFVGG